MTNEEKIIKIGLKMLNSGLTKGIWGNISMREGNTIWIKPSGVEYENIKPSDVAVIDLKTDKQLSGLPPSSEYNLHKIIYQKCLNIFGIVHTHSPFTTSFAIACKDIPCCTEEQAAIIGGHVECPEYAESGSMKLGEVVSEKLHYGNKFSALIAKHGLVAIGRNLNEAYIAAEIAEKSAETAYHAYVLNPDYKPLSESCIKLNRDKYLNSHSTYIIENS